MSRRYRIRTMKEHQTQKNLWGSSISVLTPRTPAMPQLRTAIDLPTWSASGSSQLTTEDFAAISPGEDFGHQDPTIDDPIEDPPILESEIREEMRERMKERMVVPVDTIHITDGEEEEEEGVGQNSLNPMDFLS